MLAMSAGALATGCSRTATAPELAYTLLDGRQGSFAALRGQVVLVSFWATQCAPCVAAMPSLVAMHAALQARGLHMLAVAMQHDPPAAVWHFAQNRGLPFGVVIDNTGAIARGFGDVSVTPTSILVNRQGRVARRVVGKLADGALQSMIEQLLAAPADSSA